MKARFNVSLVPYVESLHYNYSIVNESKSPDSRLTHDHTARTSSVSRSDFTSALAATNKSNK